LRNVLPPGEQYMDEAFWVAAAFMSPIRAMMRGDEVVLKTLSFEDLYREVFHITKNHGDVLYRMLVATLQGAAAAIRNALLAKIGQLSIASFTDTAFMDVRITIGDAVLGTSVVTKLASFLSLTELRALAMNRSLQQYVSALLTRCRKTCPDSRSREELISWTETCFGIYRRGLMLARDTCMYFDRNYCSSRQISGVWQSGCEAIHEAVGHVMLVLGVSMGDQLDLVSLLPVVG